MKDEDEQAVVLSFGEQGLFRCEGWRQDGGRLRWQRLQTSSTTLTTHALLSAVTLSSITTARCLERRST